MPQPEPPADFQRFYQAFLDWRAANGWDNRTASHLPGFFQSAGLANIAAHRADELVRRGEPDFADSYASGIWLYVIQTLGPQLVETGFLQQGVLLRAEEHYGSYIRHTMVLQKHSMWTVEGMRIAPAGI